MPHRRSFSEKTLRLLLRHKRRLKVEAGHKVEGKMAALTTRSPRRAVVPPLMPNKPLQQAAMLLVMLEVTMVVTGQASAIMTPS